MRKLSARLGQPRLRFVLHTQESWRAQLAGDAAAAEELAEEALSVGLASGEPDAVSLYTAQLGPLRWQQGRLGDVLDLLEQTARDVPAVSVFTALHGVAELDAGDRARAAGHLRAAARDGFDAIARDPVRLGALTLWAEVAATLPDTDPAAALYEALAPHAGQIVLDALGTLGSVQRPLGLVAAALGRYDEADDRFAAAIAEHERLGARSLVARTRLDWGEALRRAGAEAGADRAGQLLGQAAAAARELGLDALAQRAEEGVASRTP
jgi:tetratricopeptide (TPR) repeat protein